MTRDEIINEIKPILKELNYPDAVSYIVQNDRRWLEENIKALEQEPFINKPCVSSVACEHDKNKILDKIRAEIIDTLYVDSLIFGELIDFKNGKISADDVIEEFNRVTRIEVLKIIDKYKAESEG